MDRCQGIVGVSSGSASCWSVKERVEMSGSKKDEHDHTPQEERAIREAALDETIEDTFPASDPLSTIPNPDLHEAAEREQPRRDDEL
jgi:hypothetical protein